MRKILEIKSCYNISHERWTRGQGQKQQDFSKKKAKKKNPPATVSRDGQEVRAKSITHNPI